MCSVHVCLRCYKLNVSIQIRVIRTQCQRTRDGGEIFCFLPFSFITWIMWLSLSLSLFSLCYSKSYMISYDLASCKLLRQTIQGLYARSPISHASLHTLLLSASPRHHHLTWLVVVRERDEPLKKERKKKKKEKKKKWFKFQCDRCSTLLEKLERDCSRQGNTSCSAVSSGRRRRRRRRRWKKEEGGGWRRSRWLVTFRQTHKRREAPHFFFLLVFPI